MNDITETIHIWASFGRRPGHLSVTVCPLCASLVLTDGLEQHARVHAADVDRRRDDCRDSG